MNEETELALRKGQAAARLLSTEAFQDVVHDLEMRYYQTWQRSESVAERERTHLQVMVLKDLVAELAANSSIAEQLEERIEAERVDEPTVTSADLKSTYSDVDLDAWGI